MCGRNNKWQKKLAVLYGKLELCILCLYLWVVDWLIVSLPTDTNDYVEVISFKVVLSAIVTQWYTQITIVNDKLFEDDE